MKVLPLVFDWKVEEVLEAQIVEGSGCDEGGRRLVGQEGWRYRTLFHPLALRHLPQV